MARTEQGDIRAQVAVEMFVYRVQKYIGAYTAVLNGVDIIVFTGGIGENDPCLQERMTTNLEYLGVQIDRRKNDRNAPGFSTEGSRVTLMTVPANEERVIAQHTYEMPGQGVEKVRVKGNRSPV